MSLGTVSLLLPLLLLLLPGTQMIITTAKALVSTQSHLLNSRCGSNEYWAAGLCCPLCPAGEYVREPCRSPHTQGTCEKCDRGTYTAFPNGLESCLPCSICSEDQEEVAPCTPTSNRRCQCRTGRFYHSPDSPEFCRPCSTCPKGVAVLQKCHSTADTMCDMPGPGKPAGGSAESSWFVTVWVSTGISIGIGMVSITIGTHIRCCRRPGRLDELGSHSLGTIQLSTLPATDPERGPPAPGEATTPLLQEGDSDLAPGAGTRPGPSEEPGEDTELQEVVAGGSQAAPEQQLQTAAPTAHEACMVNGRHHVQAGSHWIQENSKGTVEPENEGPFRLLESLNGR
ncbi:tumor necrosis factor receptor superfamily member 26-like [Saccopteryx bilineata]|uniref:tumor necrosis factor receptor superfamily member 26-like n=1 Tax=Saccopteryx bilineata TaxID=59482 RepID=UPI00338F439E